MKKPSLNLKWIPRRADLERVLIVFAAVMVVVLALRGGGQVTETMVLDSTPAQQTSAEPEQEMQATICWYEDGDGYLVPVTRMIPKQEGVAKATLALMVSSGENDLAAARMGLTNVIPEGTTFDLNIADGKARVDMSREALTCASPEQELLMVHATAAALCCFDTVDEVTFLFDGQKRSQLPGGTDVSGVFTSAVVNAETSPAASSVFADQVQLYFPSASGRLLVPVTRTVFSTADLATAVLELAKGPQPDSGLESPLPKACGVRSVSVQNGKATIDFSSDFMSVMDGEDSGRQAVRAILFTASQFPGVKSVQLLVDGKPFTPAPETAATFLNDASEVMTQYPGVIEID